MAHFDSLPNEIKVQIFQLLDINSLLHCSSVCRSWKVHSELEVNYLPHVLTAYCNFTHGTRPLVPIWTEAQKAAHLLDQFKTSISALPVFHGCSSLKDVAVVLEKLDGCWRNGVPTKKLSVNGNDVHQSSIECVAVDARYGLLVTVDRAGYMVYWDVLSLKPFARTALSSVAGLAFGTPGRMVIGDDVLIIGSATMGNVIVLVRILRDSANGAPFKYVTNLHVHAPVSSLIMEGTMCIVGTAAAISFWDLSNLIKPREHNQNSNRVANLAMTIDMQNPAPSYSFFYRKPYLFSGLPGSQIQQVAPCFENDTHIGRDLWDSDGHTYASLASGPEVSSMTFQSAEQFRSILRPIGADGDFVVAWPDASLFTLSETMKDETCWSPKPEHLLEGTANGEAVIDLAVRDESIIIRGTSQRIDVLTGRGQILGTFSSSWGSFVGLSIDPAFIVNITDARQIDVLFFVPESLLELVSEVPRNFGNRG